MTDRAAAKRKERARKKRGISSLRDKFILDSNMPKVSKYLLTAAEVDAKIEEEKERDGDG